MHEAREGNHFLRKTRAVMTGLCLFMSLLPAFMSVQAQAAARYAAMAIDANTGTVLHNKSGDEQRYPASLTKMMTLYMTFELIKLGRLSYATKIKVTKEAAAATPSKLGLKPGKEIKVIDAIKALVTKSANDIAIALAQHIGGTEANFARLMTRRAHELGMTSTTFKNASGLPDPDQITTARDMLTLALRLQDDFPTHYKLFATRSFTYAGRTYRNHNRLLGRYRGTDGIKTGYTRASGFNLVTSVRRDGKHVVAAVFGGKTSRIRNTRMRALLNKALAKASTKVTRKPAQWKPATRVPRPPPVVRAAPPPVRATLGYRSAAQSPVQTARPPAVVVTTTGTRPETAPEGSQDSDIAEIAVARVRPVLMGPELTRQPPATTAAVDRDTRPSAASPAGSGTRLPNFAPGSDFLHSPAAPAADASQSVGAPPSTLQAQAEALARNAASSPAIIAAPPPQDTPPAVHASRQAQGPFEIQIGAYGNSTDAEQHMEIARQRTSGLLDPYPAVTIPVKKGSSQLFRARFRGFEASAAASACLELRRLQIDCFVVRTE